MLHNLIDAVNETILHSVLDHLLDDAAQGRISAATTETDYLALMRDTTLRDDGLRYDDFFISRFHRDTFHDFATYCTFDPILDDGTEYLFTLLDLNGLIRLVVLNRFSAIRTDQNN